MEIPEYQQLKANYQRVKSSNVEIVFDEDYYDGPLTGMCRINNELFWFHMADCIGVTRYFVAINLNTEIEKEVMRRHELYVQLTQCKDGK